AVLRAPIGVGRPDRLMRLLGTWPCLLKTRLAQVAVAQVRLDPTLHPRLGFSRYPGRVGSHVGDQTRGALAAQLDALVEVLCQAHRLPRPVAETARRVLLKCRRDVGRWDDLASPFPLDGNDAILGAIQLLHRGPGVGLGLQLQLAVGFGETSHEAGLETLFLLLLGQDGVYGPGFLGCEGPNLILAVDDQ